VIIEGADLGLVEEYVASSKSSPEALAQLAEAYARLEASRPYTPKEIVLFRRIFESREPAVLFVASNLARQIGL